MVRETAELAISSGLKKIDSDHLERQSRAVNVVIKLVTEHSSDDAKTRLKYDTGFVTETLSIPHDEIENVYRAGPLFDQDKKRRTDRPLIVRLKDKTSAEYWHDNGRGRKVRGYYINPDLCVADRHALFLARQEYKKRKEGKIDSPTAATSM